MKILYIGNVLNWILFISGVNAQDELYFQQKVDYDIHVKLNDQLHILEGHINIKYLNNSHEVLDKIGMHLWPNAFSTKSTEFAKQKLLHRSTRYYDSPPSESGNIELSKLMVNSKKAEIVLVKNNPDMGWLVLPELLKPNEEILIDADFIVKIPASFSRFGHIDQSYQITQWYLKPAVYDRKGWHLMPYLDQGEFYSEFGNYKVSITLPENYVVAASGVLQESKEIEFLNKRVELTKNYLSQASLELAISDSQNLKTISYKADSVHDFAWFADKKFLVTKDQAKLKSGKLVDTWCFFNAHKFWPNGARFTARAIEFYSDKVGEYPWPQATAVHSALSAGGGMEYPMITVINDVSSDKSLDQVICHEVGHNWFYGILATNERDHPWMDEGINSYYENRYMNYYYKENYLMPKKFRTEINKIGINSESEFMYQLISHANYDQYPGSSSVEMNALSYGIDIYKRTADLFKYLEDYLGETEFDKVMKKYYSMWNFKHPYPEDLKAIFQSNTTKKTEWLFEDILLSNRKIDYSICSIKKESNNYLIKIKNKGSIKAPVMLCAIKNDSCVFKKWIDGFDDKSTAEIPLAHYDKFKIDPLGNYFDYNQNNNTIRSSGIFKKIEPLRIGLRALYNTSKGSEIFVYPSVLWNYYDGLMIGLHLGSAILPTPKWNIQLSPKYAIKSKSLAGTADLSFRNNFSSSSINYLKIGVSLKKFGFSINELTNEINTYTQFRPYVIIDFKTDMTKLHTSKLSYEFFNINDNIATKTNLDSNFIRVIKTNNVNKLSYYYSNPSILVPLKFIADAYYEEYPSILENKSRYLRVDCEIDKSFRWSKRRYFETRLASSFFPINTERNRNSIASRTDESFIRGSSGIAFQGYLDYTNENNFLGRTNASGIWSQQIENRQGGFKIAPGIQQRTNLGNTNNFFIALNLSTDLPIKKVGSFIRPYFDLAYIDSNSGNENSWLYSSGMQLRIIPEFFEVNFPIYHSKNIRDIYADNFKNNYFKQITFKIKFTFAHFKNIANFIQ
ncbi:MAG: M1 family metallopeptidase [Saprospiraceae bacterium]